MITHNLLHTFPTQVSGIVEKWEWGWKGKGSRNGNDQWKMSGKGHHVNIKVSFYASWHNLFSTFSTYYTLQE